MNGKRRAKAPTPQDPIEAALRRANLSHVWEGRFARIVRDALTARGDAWGPAHEDAVGRMFAAVENGALQVRGAEGWLAQQFRMHLLAGVLLEH